MVFLELRRDSRVMMENSGCLSSWPREVQTSIRIVSKLNKCLDIFYFSYIFEHVDEEARDE